MECSLGASSLVNDGCKGPWTSSSGNYIGLAAYCPFFPPVSSAALTHTHSLITHAYHFTITFILQNSQTLYTKQKQKKNHQTRSLQRTWLPSPPSNSIISSFATFKNQVFHLQFHHYAFFYIFIVRSFLNLFRSTKCQGFRLYTNFQFLNIQCCQFTRANGYNVVATEF